MTARKKSPRKSGNAQVAVQIARASIGLARTQLGLVQQGTNAALALGRFNLKLAETLISPWVRPGR